MKTIISLFCCWVLFFVSSEAALGGYYDFCYPWSYYYQPLAYSQEPVPYFALHPPVYYGRIIARPYGDSPYPYPPGRISYVASSPAPTPKIVRNKYVSGEATAPSVSHYQTPKPLRIKNPFVEQSDYADASKGVN